MSIKLPGMSQPDTIQRDLQNFNGIHREVIRLHFRGTPKTAIATELNVTVKWVREIIESTQGQELLETLQTNADIDEIDIEQEKQRGAAESVGLLRKMVNGVDTADSLKLKAAQTLMASAGHGPIQKMVGQLGGSSEGKIALEEFRRRAEEVDRIIEARVVPLEHYKPPEISTAEVGATSKEPVFGPRPKEEGEQDA